MEEDFNGTVHNTIAKPLAAFRDNLVQALPGNIKSISLTGSVLTEDFIPGKSSVNTVLVLNEESIETFDIIAALGKFLIKNKFDMPLIMTAEHIAASQDVFGVEYLDFQLNHNTIYGSDPFESLTFNKSDVRLQCERELKADLIRLRQGYIASKITAAPLRDVLVCGSRALLPYLRAMLWLYDMPREAAAAPTIERGAKHFDFDASMLKTIVDWKYEKKRISPSELAKAAQYLYNLTGHLAALVDKYGK